MPQAIHHLLLQVSVKERLKVVENILIGVSILVELNGVHIVWYSWVGYSLNEMVCIRLGGWKTNTSASDCHIFDIVACHVAHEQPVIVIVGDLLPTVLLQCSRFDKQRTGRDSATEWSAHQRVVSVLQVQCSRRCLQCQWSQCQRRRRLCSYAFRWFVTHVGRFADSFFASLFLIAKVSSRLSHFFWSCHSHCDSLSYQVLGGWTLLQIVTSDTFSHDHILTGALMLQAAL